VWSGMPIMFNATIKLRQLAYPGVALRVSWTSSAYKLRQPLK